MESGNEGAEYAIMYFCVVLCLKTLDGTVDTSALLFLCVRGRTLKSLFKCPSPPAACVPGCSAL